jgi:hypothetical protein
MAALPGLCLPRVGHREQACEADIPTNRPTRNQMLPLMAAPLPSTPVNRLAQLS